MGELYREHGVNPLGGCLPLLVQMPIFIAFYQSLFKFNFTVEAHAKFLWIPNIGNPDPYYLLCFLVAGTTYLQQRISMVDPNDRTQKMMLYMMPILIGWITTRMPAGLPIYWTVFNILGIAQQVYVNYKDAIDAKKKKEPEKEEEPTEQTTPTISVVKEEQLPQETSTEKKEGEKEGGTSDDGSLRHSNRRKKRKKR
jgi:YidC/Oxa1 family membrane protein insertase